MDFATTSVFYLVIGAAVAIAVYLWAPKERVGVQVLQVVSALLFWPIYLPTLLQPSEAAKVNGLANGETTAEAKPITDDAIATAIRQVEVELESALRSLDGWAESALDGAQSRLAELRAAWNGQAERIRELDDLLAQPTFAEPEVQAEIVGTAATNSGDEIGRRIRQSEQARRENLTKLKAVRKQLYRDLMGTLAWVRELVTMIHLAKYTGAPASRAQELVTQIAAAVEGLSEVSAWPETSGRDKSTTGSSAAQLTGTSEICF